MACRHHLAALAASALLAACTPAAESPPPAAASTAASTITITSPWTRATAQGQAAGGGFMTITNAGAGADRLIGGSTPVAGAVEVHTMAMDNGVMRMRELANGLEIPAGASVELRPGAEHLMLMQLREPLREGSRVPLTLRFEQAGEIRVELAVAPAGAAGPVEHAHE